MKVKEATITVQEALKKTGYKLESSKLVEDILYVHGSRVHPEVHPMGPCPVFGKINIVTEEYDFNLTEKDLPDGFVVGKIEEDNV